MVFGISALITKKRKHYLIFIRVPFHRTQDNRAVQYLFMITRLIPISEFISLYQSGYPMVMTQYSLFPSLPHMP